MKYYENWNRNGNGQEIGSLTSTSIHTTGVCFACVSSISGGRTEVGRSCVRAGMHYSPNSIRANLLVQKWVLNKGEGS
eukprot:scaffold5024_cov136-Cylindrotheca_fusiformis.AAC.23